MDASLLNETRSDVSDRVARTARRWVSENSIIIDTETTGLGNRDEVVEIAAVDAAGRLSYTSLVKPTIPIPAEATAIHGIGEEDVASSPSWFVVCGEVAAICARRSVLAYNAEFDSRICIQSGNGVFPSVGESNSIIVNWQCLMRAYCDFIGQRRWKKLGDVCAEIGYAPPSAHRAMADALAAREVLLWLAKQCKE